MSKSYVTLEKQICPVCGEISDTNALLMDMRLRDRFEKDTVTGWGFCEEHQKVLDDGFIILVGVEDQSSSRPQPDQVTRTGEVLYMRKELAETMINIKVNDMAFIPPAVVDIFKGLASEADDGPKH